MLFFLTLLVFGLTIYLSIRLIAYVVNVYTTKTISSMDRLQTIVFCLTSSFGYLIYNWYKGQQEIVSAIPVSSFQNFLTLLRMLYKGLLIGGILYLGIATMCTLPFIVVKEDFERHYNIPEGRIMNIYFGMFLVSSLSITMTMLFWMYLSIPEKS